MDLVLGWCQRMLWALTSGCRYRLSHRLKATTEAAGMQEDVELGMISAGLGGHSCKKAVAAVPWVPVLALLAQLFLRELPCVKK